MTDFLTTRFAPSGHSSPGTQKSSKSLTLTLAHSQYERKLKLQQPFLCSFQAGGVELERSTTVEWRSSSGATFFYVVSYVNRSCPSSD